MTSTAKKRGLIRIGVLGGIGPESTAEFYSKLIASMQSKGIIKSNADFPQIIINSIPAPELVYDKISNADLTMYSKGLEELDTAGVDFIVMICNTIHLFYDQLQKEIKTPILDLRIEVRKTVQKKRVDPVLVLGTPSTLESGLYDFDGITMVKPSTEDVKVLAKAIFDFNSGLDKEGQGRKVEQICNKYMKSSGAKAVILGCTEFGLMLKNGNFDKINTIDVLVESTIERFRSISN